MTKQFDAPQLDDTDRMIIQETQTGLPLTAQPYHDVAARLGLEVALVMARIKAMQASGVIRRIGVVPNHYKLGYRGNGMSVWDIADADIAAVGKTVGALDCVSHCYHRPRQGADWPYNLFAMVHGHNRDEVEAKVAEIAEQLGALQRGYRILFSTRILKKTGLRLTGTGPAAKRSAA
ncbi:MAG: Lrp/AsnC family transcriptional regulator [Alphaproteobacteria bacterium]|jgi:siroheme decarboxylase|nr:Lrp/AsnC family transcriptional regulator [Alphaproteobacteria bacterium]MBT4084773.1 Lrp/AsnC family transcriptional regulator [Alphaproteobacteria bacterium]MBT4544729.1 Lrp/AsnC family transcriptional regulator [Alphaproteobacteria bacterium]MBT7745893.1 Lrp/AsnC family transcriptional regulator [Alphaproteobacteria bacterium]